LTLNRISDGVVVTERFHWSRVVTEGRDVRAESGGLGSGGRGGDASCVLRQSTKTATRGGSEDHGNP
jgi:hypothetical protein